MKTKKQYGDMDYDELHQTLLSMVRKSQSVIYEFNEAARLELLPALTAMKTKVGQQGRRYKTALPSWEEECVLIGLNAAQIRKWKHRTGTEMDIRHLLGEKPKEKTPKPEVKSVEYHRLVMLTKAIVEGNEKKADELAQRFAEEYGV